MANQPADFVEAVRVLDDERARFRERERKKAEAEAKAKARR